MNNKFILMTIVVFIVAMIIITACQTKTNTASIDTRAEAVFSLACDSGTFSTFRMKNTEERTYRDESGDICSLADSAEGVI